VTFGMRTGEVIGWEPAEAGSFFSVSIFSLFFFLILVNFLIHANYHSYENIESAGWEFTLEASFTKYLFVSNA